MDNGWVMIAVIFGLMILMMVVSIFPQRKKQKQAQAMMANLTKGDKIKTIGGFVGVITAIDDATHTMVIDLGDEKNPVLVTIDKSAVYTVLNQKTTVVETEVGKVEVAEEEGVKSVDDAEEDAKRAAKAAKKAERKAKKAAAKDVEVFEEVSDDAESVAVTEESASAEEEVKPEN